MKIKKKIEQQLHNFSATERSGKIGFPKMSAALTTLPLKEVQSIYLKPPKIIRMHTAFPFLFLSFVAEIFI